MSQPLREEAPAAGGAKELLSLTGEQRLVVTHRAGALLVFAGPGSGKTRTLTGRIAQLLDSSRADAREVLALTFTVRAAEEMRVRLVALVGHDRAAAVTVATFHGLGARILRSHAALLGRTASFSVYDQADVGRLVRDALADRHASEDTSDELAAAIVTQIALAKSRLSSPEVLCERGEHPASAQIAAIWQHVDGELRRSNAFDLPDLVSQTARLLGEQPAIRERYRRRWRHILVDEFQDTDPAQLALLARLAGPGGCGPQGSLVVVGDDDQALYAWRGAAVENLLAFGRSFPCAAQLVLRRNFRSRPTVLDAAMRCIAHNTRRQPKALIADRALGGEVLLRRFANDHVEAAWVTKRVAASIGDGTDPREVLVLCRSLRWTQPLQQALTSAGIAHRVIGARSLWERVEIRDALAHVALIANPHDGAAFRRAVAAPTDRAQFAKAGLRAPSRGCGAATQRAVIGYARAAQVDLIEACMRAEQIAIRSPAAKCALVLFGHELDAVRGEQRAEGSIAKAVIGALTIRDGPVAAYQQLLERAGDQAILRDTARVLEDLRSLCRAADRYGREHAEDATLAGFLDGTRVDALDGLSAEQDDRLTVSTIHGAKGTEARDVYLLACEERRLPSGYAIDSKNSMAIEEERRLFYVAATRAKDRLVLTTNHARFGSPTAGRSRFLTEAGL